MLRLYIIMYVQLVVLQNSLHIFVINMMTLFTESYHHVFVVLSPLTPSFYLHRYMFDPMCDLYIPYVATIEYTFPTHQAPSFNCSSSLSLHF